MRKIILYIASSLDNYIARDNGDVNWLFSDADYGYEEFLSSVDTVLMGNVTYKQILTFGEFPYKDKKNYVFTSEGGTRKDKYVQYVSIDIPEFVRSLREEEKGQNIWLVGGSQIIDILLKSNLVDELILSIHPIVLGRGVPLFVEHEHQHNMELVDSKVYPSGLVQLHYHMISNKKI